MSRFSVCLKKRNEVLPSTNGRIQIPRQIGCAQNQHANVIFSNTFENKRKVSIQIDFSNVFEGFLPSIWTKNSFFTRPAASLWLSSRFPQRESTSSIKMTQGRRCRATLNNELTLFSVNPNVVARKSLACVQMNVVRQCVAKALAKNVFLPPRG